MKKINFSTWTYIDRKNNSVLIRIRWCGKRRETTISVGVKADPLKWNKENQRAKLGSVHKIGDLQLSARFINTSIEDKEEQIKDTFCEYELKELVPC